MIFGKFFKAKWQSKETSVRVLAIKEELSPQDAEQLKILQTMIAEDVSDTVRRAALLRINRLADYLDARQGNSSSKMKEFANKTIVAALRGEGELSLNGADKQQLVDCLDKSQLEAWLAIEQDEQQVIALYQKIDKPHLLISVVFAKSNEALQRFVVDKTEDITQLEKLAKKTKLPAIEQEILSKVEQLKQQIELPEKVKKSTQLVLSKLLSLKDLADYQQVVIKQEKLSGEWQELSEQFSVLSPSDAASFTEKHEKICQQLSKALAPKAEQYQQEQLARELAEQKQNAQDYFEQQSTQIREQLANAIFQNDSIDEQTVLEQIKQLDDELSSSVLNANERKVWLGIFEELSKKLTQLPVIAESVSQGTQLISRFSQLAVPENGEQLVEKHQQYKEWQQQWHKVLNDSAGYLPASIVDAHKEIEKQWKNALSPLLAEQKRNFVQAQRKISDLKRLISSGKYNACFGVFKRVQALVAQLSEEQQTRLAREYESVTEQMNDLADWEHYIATPKKQALLDEIKHLCEAPLDNPQQQADKVKAYRQQWNSLGHADESVDQELNKAFNQACEQAFAPCRAFYAEQDKLRAQHQAAKEALIEQVKGYELTSELDGKTLENQVNQFSSRWKDTGEVDRNVYKKLQKAFNDALKPLRDKVAAFHHANTEQKKALIAKAESALALDDVYAAVNDVKGLQTEWKTIGYSGAKEENRLWRQFRKVNDEIFAKRNQVKSESDQALQVLETELLNKLASIKGAIKLSLESGAKLSALNEHLNELDALSDEVYQHKPVVKKVLSNIDTAKKQLLKNIESKQQAAEKSKWLQLFDVLEQIAQGQVEDLNQLPAFNNLSNNWQKKVLQAKQSQDVAQRDDKTLELEILAGIESPKEFAELRMEIQVSLMQQQMSSGGEIDVDKHLADWIVAGQLTENDAKLLARIKPIFC